jgi:hypothetical protein
MSRKAIDFEPQMLEDIDALLEEGETRASWVREACAQRIQGGAPVPPRDIWKVVAEVLYTYTRRLAAKGDLASDAQQPRSND